jgi:WhiB family redox-sensing transcriptional regulator
VLRRELETAVLAMLDKGRQVRSVAAAAGITSAEVREVGLASGRRYDAHEKRMRLPGARAVRAARPGRPSPLPRPGLSWQDRGACKGTDPEAFFPVKGGSTAEAKAVCAACPVRAECLEYALVRGERFGVWGGTSEMERRGMRRARLRRAA